MNTWQLCNEIRSVVRAKTWTGTTSSVFGNGSVLVTDIPDESVLARLRFPACFFRVLDMAVDPEHGQQPDLVRQRIGARIFVSHQGDPTGEGLVIGGHWSESENQSDGRGILEVEEELFNALELLGRDDGIDIQLMSSGASQGVVLDGRPIEFRDYMFESWLTTSRDYPPAREISATELTNGNVSLSWVNPATGRFDFKRMMLRRISGSTAPTSSTGTELTLDSSTSTSHTDTDPGGGAFSYSVFAVYDDRQSTPTIDREFSDALSTTITLST